MKSNSLLIGLNVFWIVAVIAAFLLGRNSADDSSQSDTKVAAGPTRTADFANGGKNAGDDASREFVAGGLTMRTSTPDYSSSGVAQTLADALADSDPIQRKLRVAQLLTQLNSDNLEATLHAFEEAPKSEEIVQHFREFLYAWARLAPEDALAYALDPESPRRERNGSMVAMSGWAAVDPAAAKEYVAAIDKKETREWMHYSVMHEMLKTDLEGAIAYSEQNTRSSARGRQMDRIVATLTEQGGVEAAVNWLEGIDHTNTEQDLMAYKRYASAVVLDRMAAEDPQMAEQWIRDNASEDFVTSEGLERASRRVEGPIDAELQWLTDLPETAGKRHAVGERFEDYLRQDFDKAGEWLASQPLGPDYDEAIQDYARYAARDNLEAAVAWAERISNEEIKQATLRSLAERGR